MYTDYFQISVRELIIKVEISSFLVITVYFILFADKKSVIVIDAVDVALY